MMLPFDDLEALHGGRRGQWSRGGNGRWGVRFRWERGDALDVELVDYH